MLVKLFHRLKLNRFIPPFSQASIFRAPRRLKFTVQPENNYTCNSLLTFSFTEFRWIWSDQWFTGSCVTASAINRLKGRGASLNGQGTRIAFLVGLGLYKSSPRSRSDEGGEYTQPRCWTVPCRTQRLTAVNTATALWYSGTIVCPQNTSCTIFERTEHRPY